MPNWYASRTEATNRLGIGTTLTVSDANLDAAIEEQSREIDRYCRRWFFPYVMTRTFSTGWANRLLLTDDLLAITTLKTDEDDDRTYEITWAATDYDLLPSNARLGPDPEPYWEIRTAPNGTQTFPVCVPRSIEIAGTWGYWNETVTTTAQLAEALDASETAIDVDDGTAFEVGQTVLVDSEQLFVSAISSNTLTVTRAVNGTTAATHLVSTATAIYRYPRPVRDAVLEAVRAALEITLTPDFYGIESYSLPDLTVRYARRSTSDGTRTTSLPPRAAHLLEQAGLVKVPIPQGAVA